MLQLVENYLNKHIIGQRTIKRELSILLNEIADGNNCSILLRGSSGSGKTFISGICANYLLAKVHEDFSYYLMEGEDFRIRDTRINILDEVHKFTAQEILYPYLDSGKYTFFICTNEYDNLKEPLVNRCINLDLEEYSIEDLKTVAKQFFRKKKIEIDEKLYDVIIFNTRLVPRSVINISKRLYFIFKQDGIPGSPGELLNLIAYYFGLQDGLTELDRKYMEFLNRNGVAGINTLCANLNIPKGVIINEIEPYLIRREFIRITPRGRKLND